MRAVWNIEDYWPPVVWLDPMLRALTEINLTYLRSKPRGSVPLLYESGVRYRVDPPGKEYWWDIANVLRNGVGDCKKLAAWRAAELQWHGVPAVALPVIQSDRNGVVLVHVIVQHPNGATEDPSRRLGMVG